MACDPPVPRVVKAADTPALLALEDKAARLGLNQRLPSDWLAENIAQAGRHYLWPGIWHRFSHRLEVSPHLRCELLLQLLEGEQVLSLLDIMPADLESLASVTSRAEVVRVRRGMDAASSVRKWDQERAGQA